MAIAHIVVLSAALVTLFGVPCAVTAARRAEERRLDREPPGDSDLGKRLPGDHLWSERLRRGDLLLGEPHPSVHDQVARCPVARPLDEPAVRRSWAERCRQDGQAFRDLEAVMRSGDPLPSLTPLNPPSIEQIAYDLRRLDRQRRTGLIRGSHRLLAEVLRAYDERLCLACRCLGLSEHLEVLEGVDREIERVRVEGQLEAAGLSLRS